MTTNRTAASVLIAALLAGCATQPSNVVGQYVSTGRYDAYDCARLAREADELSGRIASTSAILKKAADTDAGLMAVGLILFWPALLFLPATGGKAEEAELARLKGEYDAVNRASKERPCAALTVTAVK